MSDEWESKFKCRKIVLPGALFISSPFEVGLIDTGAYLREGAYLV